MDEPYFHVGRAADLKGFDRTLYRFFEMIPGLLAWGTLLGVVVLSFLRPTWAAYFIIIFDLYWLMKTLYLSIYLRQNWKRTRINMKLDWPVMMKSLKYDHIFHLVLLPFYDEGFELIDKSVASLADANYDHKKILLVLATEEKAGHGAEEIARAIQKKYQGTFGEIFITVHPKNLPGEMPGKGSNITWAAERARVEILEAKKILYEHVMVSAFDSDTIVYPDYFNCVTWHFMTTPDPLKASYQPVPLYNNNVWQAPALSRVVASSGTFWQMI